MTTIGMSLGLLLGPLSNHVVQQDLLILQDLPLQVFDRAIVSLLLCCLFARRPLLDASRFVDQMLTLLNSESH